MAIGDSKTVGLQCCADKNGFRDDLLLMLSAHDQHNDVEFSGVLAVSGQTTANIRALLPAFIAGQSVAPDFIFVNVGTNDIPWIRTGATTEAPWKDDMGAILDALHTEWPDAQILVTRPMVVTYEVETDRLNDEWMPDVMATRSPWAAWGVDEREILPGHIPDNFHADSVGYTLYAAETMRLMGVN